MNPTHLAASTGFRSRKAAEIEASEFLTFRLGVESYGIEILKVQEIAAMKHRPRLNAAVEAARAGEQGRGFAVVAAEVRSLAQRSTAAAKEIKTLIGDSVGQVEAGTRLVGAAGKTMDEIVDAVEKVTDLIGEIAASSQEQSSGIRQVHTAVTQMDEVVQQNASLVEEASAATASMNEQAGTLLQLVSRFKLEAETAPATPPPTAARAGTAQIRRLAPARPGAARLGGKLAVR